MASLSNTDEKASRDALRLEFSETLKSALTNRLGKLPSATQFANQFNFRAHGTTTITRETARKWMIGQAIPEIPRLKILIDWLDLDVRGFLYTGHLRTSTVQSTIQDDLTIETIVELLRQMDAKTRSVILITAWALRETKSTPLERLNLQALKRTLLGALTSDDSD